MRDEVAWKRETMTGGEEVGTMASVEATPLVGAAAERKIVEGDPSEIEGTGFRASTKARFAKDVFVFGWANVASLVLNGVLSFLLPRYLTIEDFGYYRLFVLYASLAGIAHLGMLEGILVRWAEKPEFRVREEIKRVTTFLVLQHGVLLAPSCLALVWFGNQKWVWMGFALAAYMLICNCSMVAQIALQSRRHFNQLAFYTVLTAAALFGFSLALEVLGRLDAKTAICSFVGANLLSAVGIWKVALEEGSGPAGSFRQTLDFGLQNTRIGWKILMANLLVTLTPSMDRFFVSGTFSIREFAVYAFAGNALAIVYTVAISSARVLYPYLSVRPDLESRRRTYNTGCSLILGLWAASLLLYFPTAYLVNWILPRYTASLVVMKFLLVSSGLVAMIHILHANYFRAGLALNRFLAGSVVGLLAVGGLLAVTRKTMSLPWVAIAMIGGVMIWWIANEILVGQHLGNPQFAWLYTLVLWLLIAGVFLGTCAIKPLWLAMLVYGLSCCLALATFLREPFESLLDHIRGTRMQLRANT